MTKLTKEEQIQAIYDLKVGYTLGHADISMLKSMSRQLLASMEQEPVAYMHHSGQVVTREECCDDKTFAICCKVETPLYAAPQLPQPAVALPVQHWEELCRQHPDMSIGDAIIRAAWWNHCAAKIQGAEPVQGWIPCSERMPEETTDPDGGATGYLVLYAEGKEPNGGFNVGVWNVTYLRRWWSGFITHWMPLPAAPKQEVK